MSDEKGFVYLAVNESMPGLVKIGMTTGDVQSRMKELSADTGVPTPFTCPYDCEVQNPAILEKQLHEHFDYCRENNKREFFRTDWQAVHAALQLWGEKAGVPLPKPNNAPSPKVGKFSVNKWAKEGDIEYVQQALAEGGDPNQKDENKTTALMWATKFGHTDIVKILLDKGADPTRTDTNGQSALFEAENGVIAKMLLDKGASPNVTDRDDDSPLAYAIKKNRADVVEALLNAGAEPKHYAFFHAENGVIAKMLLDKGADPNIADHNNDSPLVYAIKKNRADVVEALLNAGAVIESDFSLTRAVSKSHDGIVRILLEHAVMKNQADVLGMMLINTNVKNVIETDITSLISATCRGYVEVVRVLLKYGGNPNKTHSDGDTCLTGAIHRGYVEVVRVLLKYGGTPNTIDSCGDTHLTHAIILAIPTDKNNTGYQIVKMLLEYGASPNMTDSNGNSPLMHAVRDGHADIVELLLEAGAEPNGLDSADNLDSAIREGDIEIIKMLLEKGTDPKPHLDNAIKEGDIETVKMLLEKGADPKPHLDNVVKKGNVEIIKIFISKVGRDECLASAAIGNYSSVVKELLATNTNAANACKIALQKDNPDAVKLMLENNADPWGCFTAIVDENRADMVKVLLKHELNPTDTWKHAANAEHVGVAKALLDNHAYSNPTMTNFMLQAIKEKRLDVVSILIDSGANPNEGLKNAIAYVKMVELLIHKGADPNMGVASAIHCNNEDVINVLLTEGADPNKVIGWAVCFNRTDMVKDLLSKGANPVMGLNAAKNHKVNADIKWMLRRRAFWRVLGL